MKKVILRTSLVILFAISMCFPAILPKFTRLIENGEFSVAQKLMRLELTENPNLTGVEKLELLFEIERLERIKREFNKSRKDVVEYIKKYIPNVKDSDVEKWEKEKKIEFMIIDGEKKYFEMAGKNLFLIDKELRKIKEEKDRKEVSLKPPAFSRIKDVEETIKLAKKERKSFVKPVRVRITYSVSVKENVVPDGKVIRCWLPFPREKKGRQENIKLISTEPKKYILSRDEDSHHRTIYFEKIAKKDQKLDFSVVFEFISFAFWRRINPLEVKPVKITDELKPFIEERPPHIVFTDELREISKKIVGEERNPYFVARKIFQWIDENIPWASARDYSTIENISKYAYENKHGDCGIQTLLFITLCRMNGIPARWESGWTTTPGGLENMHDWGEFYLEPYGWIPVDQSYGMMNSDNEEVKWFYLGGIDSWRLIVNDDFSRELYPSKIYPRSDTVDFQRGELEWEGGNLYYDKWNYKYKVEIIKQ
ncbi:MAG: transglutaminase-like domain-containing protein [Candidatus Aminicenantia bacterium]